MKILILYLKKKMFKFDINSLTHILYKAEFVRDRLILNKNFTLNI